MVFAHVTEAPKPRTITSARIGQFFAIVLLVMAVAQLFRFEKFIPIIEAYQLPGGHTMAVMVAALIVVIEVFALPFLIRMRLSPLMRFCSMACGVLVGILWFLLMIRPLFGNATAQYAGLFGDRLDIPLGGWSVIFPLVLIIMAVWSVWGLGPWQAAKKPHKG